MPNLSFQRTAAFPLLFCATHCILKIVYEYSVIDWYVVIQYFSGRKAHAESRAAGPTAHAKVVTVMAHGDIFLWNREIFRQNGFQFEHLNIYQWGWLPILLPITSKVSVTTTKAPGSISRIISLNRDSSRMVTTV